MLQGLTWTRGEKVQLGCMASCTVECMWHCQAALLQLDRSSTPALCTAVTALCVSSLLIQPVSDMELSLPYKAAIAFSAQTSQPGRNS